MHVMLLTISAANKDILRKYADQNQGKGKQPPHCKPADQPSKPRSKSRRRSNHHTSVVQQQEASSSDSSSDDGYVHTVETTTRARGNVAIRGQKFHHNSIMYPSHLLWTLVPLSI